MLHVKKHQEERVGHTSKVSAVKAIAKRYNNCRKLSVPEAKRSEEVVGEKVGEQQGCPDAFMVFSVTSADSSLYTKNSSVTYQFTKPASANYVAAAVCV